MKIEVARLRVLDFPSIEFHENPFSRFQCVSCVQTDGQATIGIPQGHSGASNSAFDPRSLFMCCRQLT
jgi:hypothetical protein